MQRVTSANKTWGGAWESASGHCSCWRSEGRSPKFMKLSKRVLYPIEEIYIYESEATRASTWESADDVVHPERAKFFDARQIARAIGLPLYIFTDFQVRSRWGCRTDALPSDPLRPLDEVMSGAKRWSDDMQKLGIDTRDPATEHRTLQQAITSLAS